MGDPLVDRDHFPHETEGLSIFSPLFMDQGHIVGGNRDSQKVAQSLEQIFLQLTGGGEEDVSALLKELER